MNSKIHEVRSPKTCMQDFSAQTTVKPPNSRVVPPRRRLGWDTPRMNIDGDMILLTGFRDHSVFVSVCVH